ncbi:MAG: type I methionyl aminopeptidase [Deltaproteobacteria bacterium]|nr:type I methionyl aminopeptidase [Deltaproteobacteria bacterium]
MIILKSPDEIEKMRRANQIVAQVLLKLKESVAPGITTDDLDRIAEEKIRKMGGIPTFIGYRGYPKSLCTSVNEEVVHGIPGKKVLKEGDIIGLDCGVTLDGFVGDSAITVGVGKVSGEAQKLMRVTEESLKLAIEMVREGNRIGDIGHAVSTHAISHGYSVVRDFVGHGIGRMMHEEPQVPNYGKPGMGPRIKVGMVVAIEPMINIGTHEVEVLADKWTVVTKDKKLSAHFEHSIACTEKGPVVLSERG